MVADRAAELVHDWVMIALTMRYGRRAAPKGGTSNNWKQDLVRLSMECDGQSADIICLAQVETLLKTQDSVETEEEDVQNFADAPNTATPLPTPPQATHPANISMLDATTDTTMFDPQLGFFEDPLLGMKSDFSWEMISLGVEEPLPEPEVMKDLSVLFGRDEFAANHDIGMTYFSVKSIR